MYHLLSMRDTQQIYIVGVRTLFNKKKKQRKETAKINKYEMM